MKPPSLVGLTTDIYKLSVRRRLTILKISFREVCDELQVDHTKLSNWLKPDKDLYLTTVCRIEQAIANIAARKEAGGAKVS